MYFHLLKLGSSLELLEMKAQGMAECRPVRKQDDREIHLPRSSTSLLGSLSAFHFPQREPGFESLQVHITHKTIQRA